MEPNSLGGGGGGGGGGGVGGGGGGMFSGMNSSILGLELPLHQNPTNPHQLHNSTMVSYVPHEPHHHHHQQQQQPQPGAVKYPYPAKPKTQQSNLSDDEEQGFAADDSNGDAKKKISPWQRMKWTDMMVRLLITAVFYIGDEGGSEPADHSGKKKPVGLLQKKGKWKSVSRAMMEKGFYVSPQQCEDKFNDLNKRYKRVNDILGKGTACKVVENQSLLDSMELTPKMKEEVRKLLNSKHLFFREMCAYHNTCRHGTGNSSGGGGAHPSPDTAAEPSHLPQQQQQHQQQQRCFHAAGEGSKSGDEEEEEEDEEESEEDEEEEAESEEIEGSWRGQEDEEERESRKRGRKGGLITAGMQQLSAEVTGVVQDGGRSPWEKKQWMKRRLMQLEEQQMKYQTQGLELEKQRLKWLKFRSKKERDMERAKLENEKRRLENERMVLMVKQKELDLMNMQHYQQQQHSSNKRGDPSSITG